jgi:hypothetical protein
VGVLVVGEDVVGALVVGSRLSNVHKQLETSKQNNNKYTHT